MESTNQMLALLATHKRVNTALQVSDALQAVLDVQRFERFSGCIEQVHQKIELTSSLPGCEANAEAVMKAREKVDAYIMQQLKQMPNLRERILLKFLNIGIATQRAGNCYEFSFFMQSLLEKEGIKTEVVRVKKPGTTDSHIFLVADREANTEITNYNTWNPEAIIIDPFMKKVYFAQEIPSYLEVCVFNQETERVSYVPFNAEVHVLDNDSQRELVADWQMVMDTVRSPNQSEAPSATEPEGSIRSSLK